MPWFRLRFEVEQSGAEQAEQLLETLGAVATTVSDAGDQPLLEPAPGATPRWGHCRLEGLFALPADYECIAEAIRNAPFPTAAVEADFLEDDDWASRWRQHALTLCFADRLWLAPRDAALDVDEAAVLRLEPGLAFGSGSHPTTRLCLEQLAAMALSGRRLLDFGCGSGILALAALRLGAAEVVAIDHDPQALLATRENAAYNCLDDARLTVADPQALEAQPPFDVVVANILAGPLVELAPRLRRLVVPGGDLLLSGVLREQGAAVAAAYPDFAFAEDRLMADDQGGEWLCLLARKRL